MKRSAGGAALSAYGEIYGRVERKLFADVAAGKTATSLKSDYLKWYGIPARMFNAVRVSLEGKIASVLEQQKLRVDSQQRRIARAEKQVAELEADVNSGRVRLCFGSKRLWHRQHDLAANGWGAAMKLPSVNCACPPLPKMGC